MSRMISEPVQLAVAASAMILVTVLLTAADASACAVCYGNPESLMTKSIVAGVWVLLGCIGMLLMSFGGLFVYWMQRSKRLSSLEPATGGATR